MFKNHQGQVSSKRDKVSRGRAIILAATLIVSGFFIFNYVLAAHTATVTVNPDLVPGEVTNTYTFTISNDASSANPIYYIKIIAPDGFSISDALVCPTGWAPVSASSYVECTGDAYPPAGKNIAVGAQATISFLATSPNSDSINPWIVETRDNTFVTQTGNPTTIVDATAPSITAPGDIVDYEATGLLSEIDLGEPTVSDNFDPAPVRANDAPASFPLGTTVVTWTATDAVGNNNTAIQEVTVVDTTAPEITTPATQTSEATGPLTTPILSPATAVDTVDSDPIITYAPQSFAVGIHTVTWTATDFSGNWSVATSEAIITDLTAPVIDFHADMTEEATSPDGATIIYTAPISHDAVDGNLPADCIPISGSQFVLGETTITCTKTDANGNEAISISFTVTVVDTTAPDITAPVNITQEANGPLSTVVDLGIPIVSDVVDADSIVDNNAPAGFPVGATVVIWTATDFSGNTATAEQIVTIIDTTDPEIIAPEDQTFEATGPETTPELIPATATDIADPDPAITYAPQSFAVGIHTVTWTATDNSDNTAQTTSQVTIQDTTAPVIEPHVDMIEEATSIDGATVTYIAPISHDAVDGNLPAICSPISDSVFTLGPTTVTCTKTDVNGNIANPTIFTVTVVDTTAPDITAPVNITQEANGPLSTVADLGTPIVSDLVDVEPVITNNAPDSFPLGTTVVTWTATDDAGNVATAGQNVTIDDTVFPEVSITSPTQDQIIRNAESDVSLVFSATDITGVACFYTIDGGGENEITDCTSPSVINVLDGRRTITLIARDLAGNPSSVSVDILMDSDNTFTVDDTPENNPDFSTIQAAIDAASLNDTISVSAGIYTEDLTVNTGGIKLTGADKTTTFIKGVATVPAASWPLAVPNIEILASGVKIHGFTIQSPDYTVGYYSSGIVIGASNVEIYDNNFQTNAVNSTDDISQTIQTYAEAAMPGVDVSGLNIHDNAFTHQGVANWGYEGIYINPDAATDVVTVANNQFMGKILRAVTSERSKTTITGNTIITDQIISDLTSPGSYQGINVRNLSGNNQSNVTISGNTVKGLSSSYGFYQGIRIGQSSSQVLSNFTVSGNTLGYNATGILVKSANGVTLSDKNLFEGNTMAVQNDDADELNAVQNYWGTAVAATIDSKVSGTVDYDPYYVNSGKTILSSTIPTAVYVDDGYADGSAGSHYFGYDAFKTIQEGITAVGAGGTVNVAAGTYDEAIVIDKSLTLRGATYDENKNGYTVPPDYAWDNTIESIINHPNPTVAYNAVVDIVDVDNVTFEGFVVQELNAITGSGNNTSLVRVYAHTRQIRNITVRNNIIGPNTNIMFQDGTKGRMGLYIINHPYSDQYGVVNSTFSGNKIFDAKGNGNNVFIWSSYNDYGAAGPASMAGTVIEDNEISGAHRSGIETAGGFSGLVIRNNDIFDGYKLAGDTPDLKYGNGILMIRGSSDKTDDNGYGPVDVTLENNTIHDNDGHGIYMGPNNQGITMTGNDIYNNGQDAIIVDLIGNYWNPDFETYSGPYTNLGGSQNVQAQSNRVYNNGAGVVVNGTPSNGFILDATSTWWGDATGPEHSSNSGGIGDAVSDNVDFRPWYTNVNLTGLDEASPTVTISSTATSPTKISPIPITITFTESMLNFTTEDIVVNNGGKGTLNGSGSTYTISITPTVDGPVTVDIDADVAWDTSGNYNTVAAQFSITYDTTAPTVILSGLPAALTNLTTTDITVAGTDVTYYKYDLDNGGYGTEETPVATHIILSGLADGPHTLSVIGRDAAGNWQSEASPATHVWTIDTAAPTVTLTKDHSDLIVRDADTVVITATFNESMASAPTITIDAAVGTDADITSAAMTMGSSDKIWTYSWNVPAGYDGSATVTVAGTDLAGNAYAGTDSIVFTVDNIAPSVESYTPSDSAVGIDPTSNITVTFSEEVTITFSDVELKKSGSEDATEVIVTFDSDNNKATISPSDALDNNSTYVIKIETSVDDLSGNQLAQEKSWLFTTSGSYNIQLTQGWNLISMPVVPNNTAIESVLGSATNSIEAVWAYDATKSEGEQWSVYRPNGVPGTSNLLSMTAGYGYWINYISEDSAIFAGPGNLFLEGNNVPPEITLKAGWNLIGYYQKKNTDSVQAVSALNSLKNPDTNNPWWTMIMGYNNDSKQFTEIGNQNNFDPGNGYWILMAGRATDAYIYAPGISP